MFPGWLNLSTYGSRKQRGKQKLGGGWKWRIGFLCGGAQGHRQTVSLRVPANGTSLIVRLGLGSGS